MRIITLHCDYIRFKPLKKALKSVEDLKDKEKDQKEIKDPLVVLTAVEKGDDDNTVKQLVESIQKTAKEVKATQIVLYPYAHLSSNLANPDTAKEYRSEIQEGKPIVKEKDEEKIQDPSRLLKEISRSKLDTSKLKDNDHRILGQKLDLFSFNEASPGSVFFHPNV